MGVDGGGISREGGGEDAVRGGKGEVKRAWQEQ